MNALIRKDNLPLQRPLAPKSNGKRKDSTEPTEKKAKYSINTDGKSINKLLLISLKDFSNS